MKQTVTESAFCQAFTAMCREDNFSRGGLIALYEYLTRLEDDTETEFELDVIALCCDYTEYESLEAFQAAYSIDDYATMDDITNATTVIEFDGGFIIQQF